MILPPLLSNLLMGVLYVKDLHRETRPIPSQNSSSKEEKRESEVEQPTNNNYIEKTFCEMQKSIRHKNCLEEIFSFCKKDCNLFI